MMNLYEANLFMDVIVCSLIYDQVEIVPFFHHSCDSSDESLRSKSFSDVIYERNGHFDKNSDLSCFFRHPEFA